MEDSNYFLEIIFPKLESKKILNHHDYIFWFEYRESNIRSTLMAACPICFHVFPFSHHIFEVSARKILENDMETYIKYLEDHCPECHPNNPSKISDDLIFALRKF
jgi:hypothetical protein